MTRSGVERYAESGRVDELLRGPAAGYLGTGERFIRRLIAERRISYVKLGRYVRLSDRRWTRSSRLAASPATRCARRS